MKYACGNTPNLGDEVQWVGERLGVIIAGDKFMTARIGVDRIIGFAIEKEPVGRRIRYAPERFELVSRLADRPLHAGPVLFLDIDGVLNGHEAYASGYSGIQREQAEILNSVIERVPDLKFVISSAWRYMILRGDLTLRGFEYMLQVHGVLAHGRVAGHTEEDGPIAEEPPHTDRAIWDVACLDMRAQQIQKFVAEHGIRRYAVVDDLNIGGPRLVKTNGNVGLTPWDAEALVATLRD